MSTALREVVYVFEKNGKKLVYLQASHSTDKKSKTFSAIDWVYKQQNPKVAIVEGYSSGLGVSPSSVSEQISKGVNGDFYPNGEISYMVIKANEHHIPFIGGEPTLQDSLNNMVKAGYIEDDFIGFLFLRVIPQKIRAGEINTSNIETVYLNYVNSHAKTLKLQKTMTFEQFKKWYSKNQKREFHFDQLDKDETAPLSDGNLLSHKISLLEIMTREKSIMKTIEVMLSQYDTVFVAYGSSHYRLEHLIFKDYFGDPKRFDTF